MLKGIEATSRLLLVLVLLLILVLPAIIGATPGIAGIVATAVLELLLGLVRLAQGKRTEDTLFS
ncbi:hypothetical protein AK95_28270 [Paenibacillus sp. LC231]|uniref:hypothetical protein n=1 Tax=Paenibacillus sp. LC231 TaxID=1120679 RepID=UPI0008DC9F54|nr:hypothetical protein [Paenibacillus sp. LC231]OIB01328.1 hypothetical protein AK95_28270 [Paenibacillus sp. LC231]